MSFDSVPHTSITPVPNVEAEASQASCHQPHVQTSTAKPMNEYYGVLLSLFLVHCILKHLGYLCKIRTNIIVTITPRPDQATVRIQLEFTSRSYAD